MNSKLFIGAIFLAAVASITYSVPDTLIVARAQQLPIDQDLLRDGAPLKPGDRLRLTVVGFPEISGEQTVMADGGIQVPLAGYVNVWHLTPSEATELITAKLGPYVRRPQVSLSIDSLSPTRVSVTGAVNRPGPLVLDTPAASLHGASTLSEALTLAGGVTPQADIQSILIRRNAYSNRGVSSLNLRSNDPYPIEEVRVNLWQSIREGDLSADIPIYDGDEILVPVSNGLTGIEQQALLSSSLAPNAITVNVGGEVQRPGIVEISPNSDVSSAVAAAGGLTLDGAAQNIVLLRTAPDGTVENYIYSLGENSIPLANGDAIIVSQSGRSRVRGFLDILSSILFPVGFLFD
ncbi:hypothetical protein C7271_00680 [filamentous cyanobacterium CCP5]|nr:hypothetical protein C7271_00680 [filamentous cyanobacterium CCP5]